MKLLDYPAVLRDFQYKPNFGFGAYEHGGRWWIRCVMWVENSRLPFEQWEIKQGMQQPNGMFEDFDIDYMRNRYVPPTPEYFSPSRAVVEISGNYTIPYFLEGEELLFIEWMKRTIWEMEKHELDEWFRYKGELVNDPHKEVGT